ncbi:hypothetical protein SCHPADRAFT_934415 [Schizopora paradoxa]|uniref:ABM domain-containing protein n=1 Tax=Schizopora paradoxa TaxID=27342 RepID=A0A0H2S9P2_9AGAM|nr:hypothetical protein SCHPADRAFT_934415 [Schizopora paradoxa]
MSSSPSNFSGPVLIDVKMKTKPDTGDRLAEALAAIHKFANSDAEPGCLSYRIGRSGDDFLVFHKYINKDAIKEHTETEVHKNFVKVATEIVIEDSAHYYEELF